MEALNTLDKNVIKVFAASNRATDADDDAPLADLVRQPSLHQNITAAPLKPSAATAALQLVQTPADRFAGDVLRIEVAGARCQRLEAPGKASFVQLVRNPALC